MTNSARIKQLFVELAKAVIECVNGTDTSILGVDPTRHAHIQIDDFVLTGPLAVKIFEVSASAGTLAEDDPAWSKEAILDLILKHTIPFARGEKGLVEVPSAAADFFIALNKEPVEFEKLLSVFGLDKSVSEIEFGEMKVVLLRHTPYSDFEPLLKKDVPANLHFAALRVHTIDDQTAIKKSQEILNSHLAVINALCSAGYPSIFQLSHLYIDPMDFRMVGPTGIDGVWGGSSSRSRTIHPLTDTALKAALGTDAARRANQLMCSRTAVASRIRAAYELAGSACNNSERPTAFVLFSMALESSVMGDTSSEITSQLSLRVAHLISKSLAERLATTKLVKSLYGIRSAIVHRGATDITDHEVRQIRTVCLDTLAALSELSESNGIVEIAALSKWFEIKFLESVQ